MTTLTPIGDPPIDTRARILDGFYTPQPYPSPNWYGCGSITTTYTPQLVDVRTVRTKAGYLGQVWYRNEIVWESSPRSTESEARTAADAHLVKALSK